MDSGSSKGFDFASDDILCSYEDYTNQENSNGTHSDSAIGTNSSKDKVSLWKRNNDKHMHGPKPALVYSRHAPIINS